MGFRITTNMMMNSYRYNLQNSTKKLSDARDMVLTQRKFSSYADDPAAATLAFRLRRDFYNTNNHLNNTKDVYSKFNTAWHNLGGVVEDLSDATARVSSIRGNNGTAGESRTALAVVLRETAESVIHAMNQKLGDHFIFAGNDAINVPFSWSEDGKLLFRGIDVNSGSVKKPTVKDPGWMDKLENAKVDMELVRLADSEPDKTWLEELKNNTVPRTTGPSPEMSKKLDEFAAEAVKNKEMTQAQADEWLKYYKNDPAGTQKPDEPKDSKGNVVEPNWLTQAANVSQWDVDEGAQAWYKYFTRETSIKPDATQYPRPKEFNMVQWKNDEIATIDPATGLSASGLTENEINGWFDYYTSKADEPPLKDQSQTVQDWGTADMDPDDPNAYPAKLPNSPVDENGDPLEGDDLKWYEYYSDKRNVKLLEKMSKEEMYIDLGMGAEESSPNNPVKGTYFNSALSGVDYTGYGVDEDGDPKNLALIMKELADVFDNWHENGQRYVPDQYKDMSYTDFQDRMDNDPAFAKEITMFHDEYEAKAFRLMDKLKAAQEHTTEKWVELDANSVYLQTAESQLTTQASDLNLQILDIEQVDLADAITTFSWQQYCYNAALKIGNQLLSQSLIDYMN